MLSVAANLIRQVVLAVQQLLEHLDRVMREAHLQVWPIIVPLEAVAGQAAPAITLQELLAVQVVLD